MTFASYWDFIVKMGISNKAKIWSHADSMIYLWGGKKLICFTIINIIDRFYGSSKYIVFNFLILNYSGLMSTYYNRPLASEGRMIKWRIYMLKKENCINPFKIEF